MKFRMKIDAEHVHTEVYTLTKTQRKTRYLIKMNIHAHWDIFLSAQTRKRATKRKRASEWEKVVHIKVCTNTIQIPTKRRTTLNK